MLEVAMVGCGDVSVVHLEAIDALDGARLVAAVDTDADGRRAAGERWQVPTYDRVERMLREVAPDVVHIATPHDQHVDPAIACLEAGVSVLLEKPVAHTMAEAERLIATADRHPDVKIGVCLQNRYNATSIALRSLLDSAVLGAVLGGHGTVCWHRSPAYYEARPWRGRRSRSGGGVLINQAIHTLDLLQWLVGPVTTVAGRADHYGPAAIDVEDTAQIALTHAGGASSVFFATNLNPIDAPVSLQIATEQATLELHGDLTIAYADGRVEVVRERQASSSGRSYWGVSHALLIADFYARLGDPEPFWIGPREAATVQWIIDEVYRQSR
ncbi:MAG TPA: Gfo/Idh/MocA family oxidoreductase [Microlunatus sp.]|nr:Gfo/Idh/MocA family oxidoreductase [Microlunatus sp.]